MSKIFKMLCIDASTSHFGFALYFDGVLLEVFGMDFEGIYGLDKLKLMFICFKNKFETLNLDHVVFEQPVPLQFSKAVVQINQVVGMMIGLAFENECTVDWVHNRTAKRLVGVTKHGKEGKLQAIELMKAKYPKFADRITNDHIADAIVVGEAYMVLCANEKK